jgi:hypothetical protein
MPCAGRLGSCRELVAQNVEVCLQGFVTEGLGVGQQNLYRYPSS